MLKRQAAVVLMMLYLITTSGFALNLHYCFNQLTSFGIDSPSKGCIKERQTKNMKCCKDKRLVVKVKDAHESGSISIIENITSFILPKIQFSDIPPGVPDAAFSSFVDRGPPPFPDVTIYLRNRNFRI